MLKAQHYILGVPFDSTLTSGYYASAAGCTQTSEMTVKLDTSLFNYASGLEFMIVVDSVQGPTGVPSPIPNDTFRLSSSTPTYSSLPIGPNFWFRIVVAGTPTTAFQHYPCHITIIQCTCLCLNLTITKDVNGGNCTVDRPDAIFEQNADKALSFYPNPANNSLNIKGINGKTTLRLYDPFGRLVMEQTADADTVVDTSRLPAGVYSLSVDNGHGRSLNKVIVSR